MGRKRLKQLDFFEILNIGRTIEAMLLVCSNEEKNELTIYVEDELFKKLDEDIYYRKFPDGKDFQPSEETIIINFDYLVITIRKKKKEGK